MRSEDFWQLFMETGAPEAYLMYCRYQKTEGAHVFDDSGDRPQSNGLQ